MKKIRKAFLGVAAILLVSVCLLSAYIIVPLRINYLKYEPTRVAEEDRILHEVSSTLGTESDWTIVRENVYCNILKKGMTREEVEVELSKVGKIVWRDTQIDFETPILDEHLGPIIVSFDNLGSLGRLQSWGASSEVNLGAPRSSCETDKQK